MKRWLFAKRFNRFDVIAMITLATLLTRIEVGSNLNTLLMTLGFVGAAMLGIKMEAELDREQGSE